jgi:hypothetical protein
VAGRKCARPVPHAVSPIENLDVPRMSTTGRPLPYTGRQKSANSCRSCCLYVALSR